jgi:hypothetical protein
MAGRSSGYWTVTRFQNMVRRTVHMDLRRLIIGVGDTEESYE